MTLPKQIRLADISYYLSTGEQTFVEQVIEFSTLVLLNIILGELRVLQLISFFACINIQFPASLQVILGYIIGIVTIDIVEVDQVFTFLDFDEDYNLFEDNQENNKGIQINDNMQDIGFGSYNPVLNMGGLTFVIVFIFCEMIVFAFLMGLYKLCKLLRGKKKKTRVSKEGGQLDTIPAHTDILLEGGKSVSDADNQRKIREERKNKALKNLTRMKRQK